MTLGHVSEDECGEEDVHEGDFKKPDPAELHELIVTKARECPPDEDEEDQERDDFGKEDANIH